MLVIVAPIRPLVQLSAVLIVALFRCMYSFNLDARLMSSGSVFMWMFCFVQTKVVNYYYECIIMGCIILVSSYFYVTLSALI